MSERVLVRRRSEGAERASHEALVERTGRGAMDVESSGRAALERILGGPQRRRSPDEPARTGVELCTRGADIPVLGALGVRHWWLRSKGFEAGMGKRGAGVPGQPGGSAATLRTTINDHTGQGEMSGSVCEPIEKVDPRWQSVDRDCVQAAMTQGTATGAWLPPFNDCHEVVKEALDGCRIPGVPGGEVQPLGVSSVDASVAPEPAP